MNNINGLRCKINKLVYKLETEKLSPADRQKINDDIASLRREIEDISRKEPMIIENVSGNRVKGRIKTNSSRMKGRSRVVGDISDV